MKMTAIFSAEGDTLICFDKEYKDHATSIAKLDFLQDIISEVTEIYNKTLNQQLTKPRGKP